MASSLNTFFNRWNEIPRNGAAEDFIPEFEVSASWQRFHLDLAIAVLPVTAALLLVLPLYVGLPFDGFAVRYLGRMQQDADTVAFLESCHSNLNVHLPLSGEKEFFRLGLTCV